jgi:hypothetical protein
MSQPRAKIIAKAAPTTTATATTLGSLIRRSTRSGGVSTKLRRIASASGSKTSRPKESPAMMMEPINSPWRMAVRTSDEVESRMDARGGMSIIPPKYT